MANPFYIPRKSTGAAIAEGILSGGKLALQGLSLKEQRDLNKSRTELMKEDQALRKRAQNIEEQKLNVEYGPEQVDLETGEVGRPGGLAQRRVSALETQADIQGAKIPIDQKQFTEAESELMKNGFQAAGIDRPMKRFSGVLDKMGKDPRFTKGQVYSYLKSNWPAYKQMLIEDFSKELGKTVDPLEKERLGRFMQEIGDDQTGDIIDRAMPDVARAFRMEDIELGAKVATAGKEPLSTLGKLVQEYNALSPDSPMREIYKKRMEKESQATGEQISIGPDGSVNITRGPLGAMQKKTAGEVEGKIIDINEGISRLNEIAQTYRPEFLQLNTKLSALKTKWQEIGKDTPLEKGLDMVFGKATPEDQQLLQDFSDFKRSSISNINLYIKEITGAQMSKEEADRIKQGMPDPGEGIFDGDSPSQFEAKWKSSIKGLKSAQARYIFYLKNGIQPDQIAAMAKTDTLLSLKDIRDKINTRVQELIDNGVDKDSALSQVQKEFFTLEQ